MDLPIPLFSLALLCVAGLGMLCFSLAFLVDWVRCFRRVRAYWAYGLAAGLIVLVLDVLRLVLASTTLGQIGGSIWAVFALYIMLAADAVIATRLAGVTMLGMYYAAEIGHPSFPLLLRRFKVRLAPQAAGVPPTGESIAVPAAGSVIPPVDKGLVLPAAAGVAPEAGESIAPPADSSPADGPLAHPGAAAAQALQDGNAVAQSSAAVPPARDLHLRYYALSVLAVTAVAVIYSVVLFRLTLPQVSEVLQEIPGYQDETALALTPQAWLLVLTAAFGEELFFRLGVQSFLASYLKLLQGKYWIAIVLASLLWTLGHAGAVEPGWVKLAQIFPIGLLLGWLCRRYGVGSSMLAHGLFNIILLPANSWLMR